MNDTDQFIVSGATIKALAQAWDDRDKLDFFAALDQCKAHRMPEKSVGIMGVNDQGEFILIKLPGQKGDGDE